MKPILAVLIFFSVALFAFAESRHDCGHEPFVMKSDTLIYTGHFTSYEESPSPHILDESRRKLIRFDCEDIPAYFYIEPEAKVFLSSLKPGQKIKIYGLRGPMVGAFYVINVDSVEILPVIGDRGSGIGN